MLIMFTLLPCLDTMIKNPNKIMNETCPCLGPPAYQCVRQGLLIDALHLHAMTDTLNNLISKLDSCFKLCLEWLISFSYKLRTTRQKDQNLPQLN